MSLEIKRIVFKFGTKVLADKTTGGFTQERLRALTKDIIPLIKEGKEVLIVTSGAVGLGRKKLNLSSALSLEEKQACAAVGQAHLMSQYNALFQEANLNTAQILITAHDLADRKRYLNLQKTLNALLGLGVTPIINENDVVSTAELQSPDKQKSFGDNDRLSALVAAKLNADLLVILTDVEGVFDDNPNLNPKAKKINLIRNLSVIDTVATQGKSDLGRGGMQAKLTAARVAALSGIHIIIAPGHQENVIAQIFEKLDSQNLEDSSRPGTLILAQNGGGGSRQHWIGYSSGFEGVLIVDQGAKQALIRKNASLLAVGIKKVEGEFLSQRVVSIQDEQGYEIGRGLTNFSSVELEQMRNQLQSQPQLQPQPQPQPQNLFSSSPPIQNKSLREVIHKNNLVLFMDDLDENTDEGR